MGRGDRGRRGGTGDASLLETMLDAPSFTFRDAAVEAVTARPAVCFVFTESESKSRLRGAKCTLVLRDATFTFYVYSLRL